MVSFLNCSFREIDCNSYCDEVKLNVSPYAGLLLQNPSHASKQAIDSIYNNDKNNNSKIIASNTQLNSFNYGSSKEMFCLFK